MALPGFFRQVAVQVQEFVTEPEYLEHWQTRLRDWAASERTAVKNVRFNRDQMQSKEGTHVRGHPLLPLNPSLPYKYVILGAVNDAVIGEEEDDTAIVIAPWPSMPGEDDERNDDFVQGAPYCAIKLRVSEISEDDAERLLEFLEEVRVDLISGGASEADQNVPKRRRGRKPASKEERVRRARLYDAWKTRQWNDKYELARAFSISYEEACRLIDTEDRSRKRAQQKQ